MKTIFLRISDLWEITIVKTFQLISLLMLKKTVQGLKTIECLSLFLSNFKIFSPLKIKKTTQKLSLQNIRFEIFVFRFFLLPTKDETTVRKSFWLFRYINEWFHKPLDIFLPLILKSSNLKSFRSSSYSHPLWVTPCIISININCNLCLSVCLSDHNSGTPGPICLKFW